MKKILALLILLTAAAFAQNTTPGQSNFPSVTTGAAGAPVGNCNGIVYYYINTSNGDLYDCPTSGSAWVKVSGGGGGGVTSLTGDSVLTSNSASTGAVTLTQANAAGGTLFGNATTGSAAPGFTAVPVLGGVGLGTGSVTFKGNTSGSALFGCLAAACGNIGTTASVQVGKLVTAANCAAAGTAANPSAVACAAAGAGAFSCDVAASGGTCVVSDTSVSANSEIILTQVSSENSRLTVTCNTTLLASTAPLVSAKSAGTSFTVTLPVFTTNPACFDFVILN